MGAVFDINPAGGSVTNNPENLQLDTSDNDEDVTWDSSDKVQREPRSVHKVELDKQGLGY